MRAAEHRRRFTEARDQAADARRVLQARFRGETPPAPAPADDLIEQQCREISAAAARFSTAVEGFGISLQVFADQLSVALTAWVQSRLQEQLPEWQRGMHMALMSGRQARYARAVAAGVVHMRVPDGAPPPRVLFLDEFWPVHRLQDCRGDRPPPASHGSASVLAEAYARDPHVVLCGEMLPDGDQPPTGKGDPLAEVYGAYERTMSAIDAVLQEDS